MPLLFGDGTSSDFKITVIKSDQVSVDLMFGGLYGSSPMLGYYINQAN